MQGHTKVNYYFHHKLTSGICWTPQIWWYTTLQEDLRVDFFSFSSGHYCVQTTNTLTSARCKTNSILLFFLFFFPPFLLVRLPSCLQKLLLSKTNFGKRCFVRNGHWVKWIDANLLTGFVVFVAVWVCVFVSLSSEAGLNRMWRTATISTPIPATVRWNKLIYS